MKYFQLILFLITITGCSSLKQSLLKNISSPYVWAPLVGAGSIQIAGVDKKISSWASSQTPIYGSRENASKYSNRLYDILLYEAYASTLIVPTKENYVLSKMKLGAVSYVSINASEDVNNNLRKTIKRERPSGSDFRSMPSGHATRAGGSEAVLHRNVNSMKIDNEWKYAVNGLNTAIAAGSLWARVEANAHYPTDVLIGYSLGHFISGFIFDSIMDLDKDETICLYPKSDGDISIAYTLRF